jgi:O-antigen/teichoic acid export membrane protein
LQSYGRPDLVAKVSLFELLLYLPLVSLLIHKFNLEGAAFGWVLRSLAEGLILFYFVFKNRIVPFEKFYNGELKRLALISIFMFLGIFLLKFFNVAFKLIFSTALLLMFALYIWFFVIDEGEKISIHSFVKTKAIFK